MKQGAKAAGLLAASVLAGVAVSVPHARAALAIDVTYDSSVTSLPNNAQFESAFGAVVSAFETAISNDITVNLYVSYGEISPYTSLPSGWLAGNTESYTPGLSFSQITSLMAVYGTMPPQSSVFPGSFSIPTAEAKALGLSSVSYPTWSTFAYPAYDAYIGFSSALPFTYTEAEGIAPQTYDFEAAAAHEISEALGRVSSLNNGTSGFQAYPLDLYRYSAAGVSSFTYDTPGGGSAAYASTDGGVTDLGTFNDDPAGLDRSDWQTPINTSSTDAQNSSLTPGVVEGLSISDEKVLQALGYSIAGDSGLFAAANAPVGATAGVGVAAVPEPASLLMLVSGLGGVGLLGRRRR